MKILLIISSFNSLSQSVYCKLQELEHKVFIKFAISKELMIEAVQEINPDIVFCPFLKQFIPNEIFENYPTFVLHPGIIGDRGHNSLDNAINDQVKQWGVVILKANEILDGGDIYAQSNFIMREESSKASIYRNEVTQSTLKALEQFLQNYQNEDFIPTKQILNPIHKNLSQENRKINWQKDNTKQILKKINMSDSTPGVKDEILGVECYLFSAFIEDTLRGETKEILAKRDGAICIGTIDGAIWISQIQELGSFKLPATYVLKDKIKGIEEKRIPLVIEDERKSFYELRVQRKDEIAYLYFNFHNGAMTSTQCIKLKYAIEYLKEECKVLVLMGADDFFSNGIHLNILEDSKKQGEDGWSNINAMNEAVKAVLLCDEIITVASFNKNSGAGGVFLGLACDYAISSENTIFNPHYKTLGLSGSEYHTFILPKRVGQTKSKELLENCLPINANYAKKINMIDEVYSFEDYQEKLEIFCENLLKNEDTFEEFIDRKKDFLEQELPLMEECKEKELQIMYDEFWEKSSSFHTLRYDFVHKIKPKNTPKRLKDINA
ncbi:hydrogenase maturation protein [Arcobacter caeni]|uniref:Hydrogenase n=1 Tax=Arcobacter caeni TaxID=1912877 RepID=A0A363D1N6_9BACT|nr:hydrogenase maturation protein [Arcobacter caeni]PUE65202.1 hydrogenase [Arcobacter caeni]